MRTLFTAVLAALIAVFIMSSCGDVEPQPPTEQDTDSKVEQPEPDVGVNVESDTGSTGEPDAGLVIEPEPQPEPDVGVNVATDEPDAGLVIEPEPQPEPVCKPTLGLYSGFYTFTWTNCSAEVLVVDGTAYDDTFVLENEGLLCGEEFSFQGQETIETPSLCDLGNITLEKEAYGVVYEVEQDTFKAEGHMWFKFYCGSSLVLSCEAETYEQYWYRGY
jgi:hypothetical protein